MEPQAILESALKPLAKMWGIRVPVSELTTLRDSQGACIAAGRIGYPVMLKLQADVSSRAAAGLVVKVDVDREVEEWLRRMRELGWANDTRVLIEKCVTVETEHYLAVAIDWVLREPVLLFGPGGSNVTRDSDALVRVRFQDWNSDHFSGLPVGLRKPALLTVTLFNLMRATFLEFNPIGIDDYGAIVLDAKAFGDPTVLPDVRSAVLDAHQDAPSSGYRFKHLDGNVGLVTIGGGTAAVVFDELRRLGLKPANFADLGGGGAFLDRFREMLLQVLELKPRAILVCSTPLSAVDTKGLSEVLVASLAGYAARAPVVIRIPGMSAQDLPDGGKPFVWAHTDETLEAAVRRLDGRGI